MKNYKGVKWAIVGLITLTMLMGTGCEMFTALPEIESVNTPPEISSLDPSATSVALEGSCTISCAASDADGDTLTYDWTATGGTITGQGSTITWMAPAAEGSYVITVSVSDDKGGTASDSCAVIAEMRFGSIDIQSSPDGAAVYLNGEDTGNITPYTITNLEPGDYAIKLVLYHHEYREATVTVTEDETTYINWSLTHAPEQTLILQPNAADGKDSSIDTAIQDQNYGSHYEIAAGTGSADTVRAFIQFDLDSIPEDAVVIDADLGLYYYRSVGGIVTAPIGAYAVLENWNEGSVTWNNQPDFSTTVEYTRTVPASVTNDFVYWSLDDLVEGWVDGTISNYGLVLKDTDESTVEVWKGFRSSDWGTASERPKLVVHYYDPTP
jgi:hypothetical protein